MKIRFGGPRTALSLLTALVVGSASPSIGTPVQSGTVKSQSKEARRVASSEERQLDSRSGHNSHKKQATENPEPVPTLAVGNLVFTPVSPCRIVDTRLDVLGPIPSGFLRFVYVAGNVGFEDQGGTAGGCGVPYPDTAAVFINIVAVTPTGPGNLRAYPYEDPAPPVPNASVLNFGAVAGLNSIANGVALPICDTSASLCDTFDLAVYASTTTHVVVDVLGYFAP